jgi:hypothetical protein
MERRDTSWTTPRTAIARSSAARGVSSLFGHQWSLDELAWLSSGLVPLPPVIDTARTSVLASGDQDVVMSGGGEREEIQVRPDGRLSSAKRSNDYGVEEWSVENDLGACPRICDQRPYWLIVRAPHGGGMTIEWHSHDQTARATWKQMPPAGYAECVVPAPKSTSGATPAS